MTRLLLVVALLAACAPPPPERTPPPPAQPLVLQGSYVLVGTRVVARWAGETCAIRWQLAVAPEGSRVRPEHDDGSFTAFAPDVPGDYVIEGTSCRHRVRGKVLAFETRVQAMEQWGLTLPPGSAEISSDGAHVAVVRGGVTVLAVPSGAVVGSTAEHAPRYYGARVSEHLLATATYECLACPACCGDDSCGSALACSDCCDGNVPGGVFLYDLEPELHLAARPVTEDAEQVAFGPGLVAAALRSGHLAVVDVADPANARLVGCAIPQFEPVLNVAFAGERIVALGGTSLSVWNPADLPAECALTSPAHLATRSSPGGGFFQPPALVVRDGLALTGGLSGLEVFDVSGDAPVSLANFPGLAAASMAVAGGFALVATLNEVVVLDLRDRQHIQLVGRLEGMGRAVNLGDRVGLVTSDGTTATLRALTIAPLP